MTNPSAPNRSGQIIEVLGQPERCWRRNPELRLRLIISSVSSTAVAAVPWTGRSAAQEISDELLLNALRLQRPPKLAQQVLVAQAYPAPADGGRGGDIQHSPDGSAREKKP